MTYISLKTSTIQITGKNGHVIIMLSKHKQTNQTGYLSDQPYGLHNYNHGTGLSDQSYY